jgi:hypothetical protein
MEMYGFSEEGDVLYTSNVAQNTHIAPCSQDYLISIIWPVARHMRIESVEDVTDDYENITDTYLTMELLKWACTLGIDSCVHNATALFKSWMAGYDVNDPDLPRFDLIPTRPHYYVVN